MRLGTPVDRVAQDEHGVVVASGIGPGGRRTSSWRFRSYCPAASPASRQQLALRCSASLRGRGPVHERPAGERRAAVLDQPAGLFGPRAASPATYAERDWDAEPFTRGACSAVFPSGAWTQYGPALRAPVGRIHWAGAETSPRWYGHIEGVIRSGEATATAIAPLKKGPSPPKGRRPSRGRSARRRGSGWPAGWRR
ncbi:flavin monoamine oxidase family protein [Nonomuraea solani]|uniref:flavin monoamine oxidase family protein n=1 Tax=Nonomuraea solani TaxID=1144553 RepID=UPI003898F8FB